ncbi:MAG: hypothetical protein SX243_19555 [Acidobacteriota bacterium]|nr:hypothetical protein [Acidobacteriota bacterium]
MAQRMCLVVLACLAVVGLWTFTVPMFAGEGHGGERAGVVVGVPAQPGPVDGTDQDSDEFIWRLFTQFTAPAIESKASPVIFETWASDADTFSVNPKWPEPDAPKKFQVSVLAAQTNPGHGWIDVPCNPPPGAAVGGFPTSGDPKVQCIAEETKRNRPQFDYIVANHLNTQAGLKKAYAKSFNVAMPTTATSVKGDWVPVKGLMEWIPSLGSVENVRKLYYTNTSEGVEYALVSLHVSSRQNPKWVWGSFEHQMNPGRCDYIGCFDSFGAAIPAVPPNLSDYNSQYGPCSKTEKLRALMDQANLSPVWENYCMKATMVDFTASDGTPYVLGNSVIEGITGNGTVAASSCISCHNYASFGSDGKPTAAATNILPFNPTGQPIPGVLNGSLKFDFMWGVLLAPAGE